MSLIRLWFNIHRAFMRGERFCAFTAYLGLFIDFVHLHVLAGYVLSYTYLSLVCKLAVCLFHWLFFLIYFINWVLLNVSGLLRTRDDKWGFRGKDILEFFLLLFVNLTLTLISDEVRKQQCSYCIFNYIIAEEFFKYWMKIILVP